MKKISRRKFLITTGALLGAGAGGVIYLKNKKVPLGFQLKPEYLQQAQTLLSKEISVDVHAHPGRSFVDHSENLNWKLALYRLLGSFEDETISAMKKGGLTVVSFATVSDFQLLNIGDHGLKAEREFEPGEAWLSYQHQMARMHRIIKDQQLLVIKTDNDFVKAKTNHQIGAFLTTEGGDFLSGSLEHFDQAYEDGIRSITIVHYHVNEIGDIQTQAPVHHGLTAFGKKLVQKMNQRGVLIDLAHASKKTAMDVLNITSKPVMVSHTAINRKGFTHPRFIDQEQANEVVRSGGIIGAWPAGLGLDTLNDYIEQIFHLVDEVGIDSVAIGTDMDANYKPVFDDYAMLPILVGGLLQKGMHKKEVGKILGGNFMRVFKTVTGDKA